MNPSEPAPVVRSRATTLILWRHGVTDWNEQGLFQGQADIPLNDYGQEMARLTTPHIAALRPTVVYSSPLVRARQTARHLEAATGLAVFEDDRLMEMNVGTLVGLSLEQVRAADPAFDAALARGEDYRRSPSGETSMEVSARVSAALTEIAARHAGQTIAVVGHGLALRMGIAGLLGWDFQGSLALSGMVNCGWAVLRCDGLAGDDGVRAWRLRLYNASAVAPRPGTNNTL